MDFTSIDCFMQWSPPSDPIIVHQNAKSPPTLIDASQALQQLRALLPTRPDVAFFRTDMEFVHRFLKVRKYRIEDAFQILCRYFTFRHQNRDLCVGLSATSPKVQAVLLDGTVGVLPEKDPCGRPILVVLAANWDYSSYDVRSVYQAILVTLEHLVQKPEVQDTGVVAIVDWSHFSAKHATSLTPKTLRIFLEGLQDSFPLRLGALHIVSPPWYVEAALSLSKPFLKDKLKERTVVHGNNLHALHAVIPPRLLPAELGGEGPEYNAHTFATTLIPKSKITARNDSRGEKSSAGGACSSASFDAASNITTPSPIDGSDGSLTRSLLQMQMS